MLHKTRRSLFFSTKHNDYFEPYHNRLCCFPVAHASAKMFTFGLFLQTLEKQKPPTGTRVMASQLLLPLLISVFLQSLAENYLIEFLMWSKQIIWKFTTPNINLMLSRLFLGRIRSVIKSFYSWVVGNINSLDFLDTPGDLDAVSYSLAPGDPMKSELFTMYQQ